jgi:di/tricarboxylate transporter
VAAQSADAVASHEAVALWQDAGSRVPQPGKTWVALSILAAVIIAGSFGLTPTELAASGGAVLMVLSGVLTPGSAARALDMRVLFLIAGSIGLGEIVVQTNLMIMRPGGYTTRSFALFGIPVLAASLVAASVIAYLLYSVWWRRPSRRERESNA